MTNVVFSENKRRLLQKYLHGDVAEKEVAGRMIRPRRDDRPALLSLSQEQLFLRETETPGIPPLYNECITLQMSGALNATVLKRCLDEIIRRHEIWRTSYDVAAGNPIQVVHPPGQTSLPLIDLRSSSPEGQEAEVQAIIGEVVRQPFDFKEGSLVRFRLIKTGEFTHRLFLIAHLSVVDGISAYQIFPSELAALYGAYYSGQPSPLRSLSTQFGDYVYWQREWLQGEELNRQLAYWRKQLAGTLPLLNWPKARPTGKQTFRGAIRPFMLSKKVTEALRQLAARQGVTLFTALLAAFAALLHSYTQQDDIVVGTLSPAGRKRSEAAGLIGHFLNPVGLRFDLADNPTFCELLRQAQRLTLEAISNDDVPVEVVARELSGEAGSSRNSLFSVAISLQPPMPKMDLAWTVTSLDVESGGSPWDFYIAFIDHSSGMLGRVQYNPDLFEADAITRIQQHFQQMLERVTANPLGRPSELSCFTANAGFC